MPSYSYSRTHFGKGNQFEGLYKDGLFCDLKLCSSAEPDLILRCHRVVLAAFSPHLRKILMQNPDTEKVVSVRAIKYNTLNAIVKLIYKGSVKFISEEEHSDFVLGMRILMVRLGGEVDQVVYEEEEGEQNESLQDRQEKQKKATTKKSRSDLRSGAIQYQPIKTEGVPQTPQTPQTPVSIKTDTVVSPTSHSTRPGLRTVGMSPPLPVQNNLPNVDMSRPPPVQESLPNVNVSPALVDTSVPPPSIQRQGALLRPGPTDTSQPPPSIGRANYQMDMNLQIRVGSGGSRNVLTGQKRTLESTGQHPIPAKRSCNVEIPGQIPIPAKRSLNVETHGQNPIPAKRSLNVCRKGPSDLFWIQMKNAVLTTQHAVNDKFQQFGLDKAVGSYNRDEYLYLAFPTKETCELARNTISAQESCLELEFVDHLPPHCLSQLPPTTFRPRFNHNFHDCDFILCLGNLQDRNKSYFVKRLLKSNNISNFVDDKVECSETECFVPFQTLNDLEIAIHKLNNVMVKGQRLIAKRHCM